MLSEQDAPDGRRQRTKRDPGGAAVADATERRGRQRNLAAAVNAIAERTEVCRPNELTEGLCKWLKSGWRSAQDAKRPFVLLVRREGALHQRVQVPPEELSMCLGSYRARSRCQSDRGFEAPRQKASERGLSKHAGRNASEV